MTDFRCPVCGGPTQTRAFSGGKEWCCLDEDCGTDGSYPARVLPCFKCGKALEQAIPGGQSRQPSGATVFRAPGNYGSSLWDPVGSPQPRYSVALEVNICDACLREGCAQVLRVETRMERNEHSYMWVPDNQEAEEETMGDGNA